MARGKKTGGRQKGTPNKRSQQFDEKFDDLVEKYGDPLETLFCVLSDEVSDTRVKTRAASELLSYRYPKRKAIELDDRQNHNTAYDMTDQELMEWIMELQD